MAVRGNFGKNAFANLFVNVKRLQPLTKNGLIPETKRLFEITNFIPIGAVLTLIFQKKNCCQRILRANKMAI